MTQTFWDMGSTTWDGGATIWDPFSPGGPYIPVELDLRVINVEIGLVSRLKPLRLPTFNYFRGDTQPAPFSITNGGQAYDLTGRVVTMTVSRVDDPTTANSVANQISSASGFITDPTAGFVSFPIDTASIADTEFDSNGFLTAFYDIQENNNGLLLTYGRGVVLIEQDITK